MVGGAGVEPAVPLMCCAVVPAELGKGHNLEEFCERFCLRHKALLEINKLRAQLTNQGRAGIGLAVAVPLQYAVSVTLRVL
jgi:hypothetical protein